MAYCRLSNDCDVYVYESDDGWQCCFCKLTRNESCTTTQTPELMADHLEEHRRHGHRVPQQAIYELRNDRPEFG